MQEKLYRGKRTDNGCWIYGDLIQCGITGKRYIFPVGGDANESDKVGEEGCLRLVTFEVIPETVGQFIEKINGVDIFHHDIVKAYKYGDVEKGLFVNEITHRHGTWWFGSWTWLEFLSAFRCVEVIGNIHDSPDLLKGEGAE